VKNSSDWLALFPRAPPPQPVSVQPDHLPLPPPDHRAAKLLKEKIEKVFFYIFGVFYSVVWLLIGNALIYGGPLRSSHRPLMDAKSNSKTHLQKACFVFSSRFVHFWLQILQKMLVWSKKNFPTIIPYGSEKNPEFDVVFESVEKVRGEVTGKKVTGLSTFAHSTKRWETTKFVHIYFKNFFFAAFLPDSKSASKFCIFYTHQSFISIILVHFANFEAKCARNTLKNEKNFLMNVNQNKLYFLFPVQPNQVVKIIVA
jgi:hypothetical protein